MRTFTFVATAAVALGALLAGCGNSTNTAAPTTTTGATTPQSKPPANTTASGRSTSTSTTATDKTVANDNSCGPVEICGNVTVSGAQTVSSQFFSVLSDLNNKRCADWAKGADDGKTLKLPIVGNAERTVTFNAIDDITYHGPATYNDSDLLKDAHLTVNEKPYGKGTKGKAEVTMAANGNGSITLTDWTLDGEGSDAVTAKATWTCTDK
jgi:hypothetical protein